MMRRTAAHHFASHMRLAYCTGMRRSLRSTKTMNATTANMMASSRIMAEQRERAPGVVADFVHQVSDAARQADDDAGEDQQRHAVADAALSDLLAQPHDEGGAGGQSHDSGKERTSGRDAHELFAADAVFSVMRDSERLDSAEQR